MIYASGKVQYINASLSSSEADDWS